VSHPLERGVNHQALRDYHLFIIARNFGKDLDVSWFLTVAPSFLKRTVSKYAMGNPNAISMSLDVFDQQELSAFSTVTHHCLLKSVKALMEELEQDFSTLNTKSKGFLEVW
jgi:hypothetical protein